MSASKTIGIETKRLKIALGEELEAFGFDAKEIRKLLFYFAPLVVLEAINSVLDAEPKDKKLAIMSVLNSREDNLDSEDGKLVALKHLDGIWEQLHGGKETKTQAGTMGKG